MASTDSFNVFKETRLNLESASVASIIDLRLPSLSSQGRSQKRPNCAVAEDEKTFRAKTCATASSIYQRKYHSTPKAFLWRITNQETVLNIRVADVCRGKNDTDPNLVLNLCFPQPIRSSCIAFADSEKHDVLVAFVLDQTNHLYTITLKPEVFRKRSATESGLGDSCKIYLSSAFSFKSPHRIIAISDDQLLFTLHDGGVIRFDRNKTNEAVNYPWKETHFNAKGMLQGFKSLFKGGHTVKYGNTNMELSAATSLASTSMGFDDVSLLFTVCLDHRMRVWNLEDGQILQTRDILDAERNPQEIGKWTIDPSQSNLLRLIEASEGVQLLVTYSPIGAGEFKFWNVQLGSNGSLEITDAFPDEKLVPYSPQGSDVWTLADFAVARPSNHRVDMWLLWKNNITYRVQRLKLDPLNPAESWENGWTSIFYDSTSPAGQASSPCDPTDSMEYWLDLIFSPGRFTKSTIESALAIYERGLGTSKDTSSRSSKGLAEAVCSALSSTASLDRGASGTMNYDQFRASSEVQWRRFYRLLIELDKQRGEAVSLVYDNGTTMAWVVCADGLSAIRRCSPLDQVSHGSRPPKKLAAEFTLVNTGLGFLDVFSDSMLQLCNSVLRAELFEDSSKTDFERVQHFLDKTGFWRQVSEEDCTHVTDALGSNFEKVSLDLYEQALSLMNFSDGVHRDVQNPLTEFGRKVIVKAVQETVDHQWKVCFSQLVLLVHMEFEYDNVEDALHNRVDVGLVYRQLIKLLHRLELVRWLAKTQLSIPVLRTERQSSVSGNSPVSVRRSGDESQDITALEAILGHLLGLPDTQAESLPTTITAIVTNLCAPDSDIELPPQFMQCNLLVRDRADLALELSPFSDQDPFSTYVQGRVHLALKDYDSAAVYFKKAAYGLSTPKRHADRHSGGLLDDTEWKLFNNGLPLYYSHIVGLYDRRKAHAYVVEFAQLSLRFIDKNAQDDAKLHTEILSRLFSSAAATSDFDLAHSTLVSMADRALQHSSLRTLVQKMCDSLHSSELVGLPFPGLQTAVDDILAQKCQSTLDVVTGVPYHQVLYSWRVKHNDYRGAAAILLDRIQKSKQLGQGDQLAGEDVLDTPVTKQFLMLINVLSCVDPKQAWICTEVPSSNSKEQGQQNGVGSRKRKVVTLADIRKQYQHELDRIAAIQNNQFGFTADDEMDVI